MSCACSCPGIVTPANVPEMVPVSNEQLASAVASGTTTCVATALAVPSGQFIALEPVAMEPDCSELVITAVAVSFTIALNGVVYLVGANDPYGTWTLVATYNISAIGATAFTPATGFGFAYWKLILTSGVGTFTLGDVCGVCSHG